MMSDHLPLDINSDLPPGTHANTPARRDIASRSVTLGSVEDEIHLTDYLKVLYRHRYIGATAFLLVVLSTVLYTFTATPIYEARAQLLIEAENPNVVSFKEVIDQ